MQARRTESAEGLLARRLVDRPMAAAQSSARQMVRTIPFFMVFIVFSPLL